MPSPRETVPAYSGAPLRQGDILERSRPAAGFNQEVLVMTADCDLANNKNAGVVLTVPLLSIEGYLSKVWYPSWISRKLAGAINSRAGKLSQISTERYVQWAATASDDDIAELGQLQGGALREEIKRANVVQASFQLPNSRSELIQALQMGGAQKPLEEIKKALTQRFPGDAKFLVNPLWDDEPRVAYLRGVEILSQDDIHTSGFPSGDYSHQRRFHMRDRELLALTRQFADVYSSIGLPDCYEEERKAYAEIYWSSND